MGTHRHTQKDIQKGDVTMAIINIKDVKQAIRLMTDILSKLDEIYHALKDATKEKE